MSNLQGRLTRLETQSRMVQQANLDDEEILHAIRTGTYDQSHMDALFRVVEPGALGFLLMYAKGRRRRFGGLLGSWQRPLRPLMGAVWIVAAGTDIHLPAEYELADWERWFSEPIDESPKSRDKEFHVWVAHEGIVKRLFLKHGRENLQSLVRAMAESPEPERDRLIAQFVPRADEESRQRMGRLTDPLRNPIAWQDFPLVVLSPDGDHFWWKVDKGGQAWTSAER